MVFDRYHLMTHMGKAVDEIRKKEHRVLKQTGDETLSGSQYLWLYPEENLPEKHQEWFSVLKGMKLKTARMIHQYLHNVLTYFTHPITNAVAEGLNSKILTIKKKAYGFRNREHFKTAIFFHYGGLQLYPVTH